MMNKLLSFVRPGTSEEFKQENAIILEKITQKMMESLLELLKQGINHEDAKTIRYAYDLGGKGIVLRRAEISFIDATGSKLCKDRLEHLIKKMQAGIEDHDIATIRQAYEGLKHEPEQAIVFNGLSLNIKEGSISLHKAHT